MKTIAYIRVSTDKQDCKNQRYEILNYCDSQKISVDQWLELEISSRKTLKERRIDELLGILFAGDRLIVSELSRLGRSTGEVIQIVKQLTDAKIEFRAIKQGMILNSVNGNGADMASKVMVTIFSLLAELERDLISDRTRIALAAARAKGVKLGRPEGPGKSKLDGREIAIKELLNKGIGVASIAKIHDVAWGTAKNWIEKNLNGMKPKGKQLQLPLKG